MNNSIEPKKCSVEYIADTCEPREVEPYTFEQAPPFVKVQYMSGNCTQPTMLILLPNGYWDPDVDEDTSFYKIAQICRTFNGKPVGVGFVEPKK